MSNLITFIDLDGCCIHVGDRFTSRPPPNNNGREDEQYAEWLNSVQTPDLLKQDHPVAGMQEFVRKLDNVVYLTSRHEKYLEDTLLWLRTHNFPPKELIMRSADNTLPYQFFKEISIKEKLKSLAKQEGSHPKAYNVIVIDDDPKDRLKRVCEDNGWVFLKNCSGGKVL